MNPFTKTQTYAAPLIGLILMTSLQAQEVTPPDFVLGDIHSRGTNDLIEVQGSTWILPEPEDGWIRLPVTGYPLLGDWDGDGRPTPGVYTAEGEFHLSNDWSGNVDTVFVFGERDSIPIVGDWDGDGIDTVGVYRNGIWNLTDTHSAMGTLAPIEFGGGQDYPVAGDWNADGRSTPGLYADAVFRLSDSLSIEWLTFVAMPQSNGHPVTFPEVSGDSVALVATSFVRPGVEDPIGRAKLIIRPGPATEAGEML